MKTEAEGLCFQHLPRDLAKMLNPILVFGHDTEICIPAVLCRDIEMLIPAMVSGDTEMFIPAVLSGDTEMFIRLKHKLTSIL